MGQERQIPGGPGRSPGGEVALVMHLAALGLANSGAVGMAGTPSARFQDTGPNPTNTARTTVSPLFLVAMHPEAVAAFPTPAGRMWDFPGCEAEDGCETQQQEALQAGSAVTQLLVTSRDSADGLSPHGVCGSPSPGAFASLNPYVFHPALNFAIQEVKK